ncbi:MAG: peptidoglycan DD-metalloendopeptidase family protein [Prevotellaceae bacterium]|nr:peptidoglycan DD-metalloendopeptidase family protein [Prevotellaceae bacterium]
MTFTVFTGYAQDKKNNITNTKTELKVKKIEPEPIVIVQYGEEDVDEILSGLVIDSLDLEFGIGGDDLIPASDIYSTWSNIEVNPYKQDLITDTITISLLGFNFPLIKFYRINSEFGQRRRRYHYGIDLKIERGDTVVSSLGGMVRIAQSKNKKTGYGYYVVIRHFNGLETFYAHLDKVLVKPDQMVTCGEVIGLAGNTGRSTGPHLHYELRYQGRPINPRDIIDFDSTLHVKSDTLLLTASHFVYPKRSSRVSQAKKSTSTGAITASTLDNTESLGIWVVKSGDTLGRIANKTGTSINKLCTLNGITRNKLLKIGQKIKY